jgi:hypothetical protein
MEEISINNSALIYKSKQFSVGNLCHQHGHRNNLSWLRVKRKSNKNVCVFLQGMIREQKKDNY